MSFWPSLYGWRNRVPEREWPPVITWASSKSPDSLSGAFFLKCGSDVVFLQVLPHLHHLPHFYGCSLSPGKLEISCTQYQGREEIRKSKVYPWFWHSKTPWFFRPWFKGLHMDQMFCPWTRCFMDKTSGPYVIYEN